jgi:hypothetical protein
VIDRITMDKVSRVSEDGKAKHCKNTARWFAEPVSSNLKMEAISSSETSGATQRTTRRHIPEDDTLHYCYYCYFVSGKKLLLKYGFVCTLNFFDIFSSD